MFQCGFFYSLYLLWTTIVVLLNTLKKSRVYHSFQQKTQERPHHRHARIYEILLHKKGAALHDSLLHLISFQ